MLTSEVRPQPIVDHRVDEFALPQPLAPACPREQVGRVEHRLHATCHDGLELAEPDQLIRVGDRREAGQADIVERDRRNLRRDSSPDRGLARGDLANAGLEHVTHDDMIDLVGADARTIDGRPDRDRAEFDRRACPQHRSKLADRGSGGRNDDRSRHDGCLESQCMVGSRTAVKGA